MVGFKQMIATAVLGVSPAVALAGHHGGFRIDVEIGRDRPVIVQPVPDEPHRVWVDPVYRTVVKHEWVPAQYRTVAERVWVPERWEDREVRGWHHRRFERVLVEPGHYEDVQRQELLCDGHYQDVTCQEVVVPGHWEDRY